MGSSGFTTGPARPDRLHPFGDALAGVRALGEVQRMLDQLLRRPGSFDGLLRFGDVAAQDVGVAHRVAGGRQLAELGEVEGRRPCRSGSPCGS
jgi:hypothetical protein